MPGGRPGPPLPGEAERRNGVGMGQSAVNLVLLRAAVLLSVCGGRARRWRRAEASVNECNDRVAGVADRPEGFLTSRSTSSSMEGKQAIHTAGVMTAITVDSFSGPASLEQYVRGVSTLPFYDVDEERRLFRLARGGDATALEAVVSAHLRFVVDLALERRGWGASVGELIEAGNRGLMKAAHRFDPDGGRSFLGYAAWWVRQEMAEMLELT